MAPLPVKKVVAVCFLEATKLTLEHLGAHRLELSQSGHSGSAELPRLYGDLRRLRDYLQRCASGYQDTVELDLSKSDQSLLVACSRRCVDSIDMRLNSEQIVPADERQWLQRKRQVLADWAVELAEKPLQELPMPRLAVVATEATRALLARLQQKLFGSVEARKKILPPSAKPVSQTAGLSLPADDFAPATAVEALPPPTRQGAPSISVYEDPVPLTPLLDSRKLRDPRLRNLAAMDLRSFDRSMQAQDFRLAAVLLVSVLEAAILDHAIPRRTELALTGGPETWNIQELLVRVMGEAFAPKDRSVVYHLFGTRNLLRPALQITTPNVVTAASLERLREFADRALHSMGFASAAPVVPEPDEPPMLRPGAGPGANVAPPDLT